MARERWARLIVAYVVVVVGLVAASEFNGSLRRTLDRAEDFRSQPPGRRAMAGGMLLDVDPEWMRAVRAFVGPEDRYAFQTGPRLSPSTRLTFRFLPTYLHGALLPSEPGSAEDANWLLCYGCEFERFSGFRPVWVDGGYVIGRRSG